MGPSAKVGTHWHFHSDQWRIYRMSQRGRPGEGKAGGRGKAGGVKGKAGGRPGGA